jgi:hypothetical protein
MTWWVGTSLRILFTVTSVGEGVEVCFVCCLMLVLTRKWGRTLSDVLQCVDGTDSLLAESLGTPGTLEEDAHGESSKVTSLMTSDSFCVYGIAFMH